MLISTGFPCIVQTHNSENVDIIHQNTSKFPITAHITSAIPTQNVIVSGKLYFDFISVDGILPTILQSLTAIRHMHPTHTLSHTHSHKHSAPEGRSSCLGNPNNLVLPGRRGDRNQISAPSRRRISHHPDQYKFGNSMNPLFLLLSLAHRTTNTHGCL